MALVPILILRNVYTKIIKLREGPPRRRQDSALERPLVAISTVSRDYNIVDTITSPSAPPHTIALPAGEEDAPPPEYLPPPAYNEC
ncbi:unnamed protein product [Orchesella dallaii]|uniref:Uncharacterized protein n=1 Tax=Orchesella dallaii TaxID=48710 RepID=A0ABP1S8T0_9HEXA